MRTLLLLLLSLPLLVPGTARALSGPLYGLELDGTLHTIDPTDASLTLVGEIAGVGLASGLARDPITGRLWFADHGGASITLKSIDLGTLATTVEATLSGFGDDRLRDLAFLPDGSIYALGWTFGSGEPHELYSIARATGAATSVLTGLRGGVAALDATTLLLQGGDGSVDVGTLVPFDDSGSYTGALTNKGTQLAYAADDNDGWLLAGCRNLCTGSPLYRIDRDAKVYTLVGTPGEFLGGIAVPEPGAAALLLPALLGLARRPRP